jgi:transcriptional regulator with XRE-family HTH domain
MPDKPSQADKATKAKATRTEAGKPIPLGPRLRELRLASKRTLRDVEADTGLNSGYLSQLEQGKVSQPTPAVLHKVAVGYGVPLAVVMSWAGYIDEDAALSTNQARALSYLGDDPTTEEVDALKAVLDLLRSKQQTGYSGALDLALPADSMAEIRGNTEALLREADAVGRFPTQLADLSAVAGLVAADEISLTPHERKLLERKFGPVVHRVWNRLQGLVDLRSNEVWVKPDLAEVKRRFVHAHEIGHTILPWQRETFAYLDDRSTLDPDIATLFEREANQAAIELLSQGHRLVQEVDDSRPSFFVIDGVAAKYGVSFVAAARRVAECSRRRIGLIICYRGDGFRGPPHFYCSPSFEQRFRWQATGLPPVVGELLAQAAVGQAPAKAFAARADGKMQKLRVQTKSLPHSLMVLLVPRRPRPSMPSLP